MISLRKLAVTVALMSLAGCQGVSPVLDAARVTLLNPDAPTAYRPGFEYLQIQINGRQVAMALGRRQNEGRSTIEYWYSGQREMLVLKNGRIHQALGMTHEVRQSLQEAPDWALLEQRELPYAWYRTLDIQPGYRYGVKEYVETQKLEPGNAMQANVPEATVWFVENLTGVAMNGRTWRYTQIFALVNQKVVYSVQCVAPDLCFTLRTLGVVTP